MNKLAAIAGIVIFPFIAFLLSENRKKISWLTVFMGIFLQFLIALFMLKTAWGQKAFKVLNDIFMALLGYSDRGAQFLFGNLVNDTKIGAIVAFKVLPIIIFISSFMYILAYLGVIQVVIKLLARVFYRSMKISGAEAFASALFIFMGIETVTGIKRYVEEMTDSEIFLIMTAFLSTIAGSVMATYVSFGAKAGHLMAASLMSAPAAVVMAKMMVPEKEVPKTAFTIKDVKFEVRERNIVEAAAQGASDGMNLALQIAAMLIAFVSLIYMFDSWFSAAGLSLEKILGYLFSPFAFLMGIPWKEAIRDSAALSPKAEH